MLIDYDKTAFITETGKEISYHTLLQKIYLFSQAIELQKDDRAMILSETSVGYIYALFAIWSKGASYTQCFYNVDEKSVGEFINDIKPEVIFVSLKKYDFLLQGLQYVDFEVKILLLDELEKMPVSKNTPIVKLSIDESAVLFRVYTAGITTKHKPVEITMSNMMYVGTRVTKIGLYGPKDRVLVLLPFFNNWILLSTVIAPLLVGATCVFTKEDTQSIIDAFYKHKVSIAVLVKVVYERLIHTIFEEKELVDKDGFSYKLAAKINNEKISKIIFRKVHKLLGNNIRFFMTVGAKLEQEIYQPLLTLGIDVLEGYGLAEASSLVTYPISKRTHPDYVGKIIDGLEYKTINNELVLRGESIGKKYYNREMLNQRYFNNGWFFTSDVVEIDDKGLVKFIGRLNEEIILNTGRVIIPAELESRLNSRIDYIAESGVFYQDNTLKAVIIPNQEMLEKYGREDDYLIIHSIIRWKVVEYYNHSVPQHKRINKIIISEKKLGRSTSGKIKRHQLYDYEKSEIFL